MQYLEFGVDESMNLKYDYHMISSNRNKYFVNLFYIAGKSCRDRLDIRKIIANNKDMNKIRKELYKINYLLILKHNLSPNISYYYIIKNNEISKNLFGNVNTFVECYTNTNKYIDNINRNKKTNNDKLDLSDLD